MRHRQVEVETLACTDTTLFGKTCDARIEVGRIAVHRHVEHVIAVVENLLNTLTMVHVGIQHRYPRKTGAQYLRRHRRVVHITETTRRFGPGVVTRWPAQGIGCRLAIEQRPGTGDGALRRPVGRTPGLLAHRATAIGQIARRLRENSAQGIGFADKDVRHHLVAPILGNLFPALMGFLQKPQVRCAVHRQQRIEPGIGRLLNGKAQRTGRLHQALRTLRHFLRRTHLATGIVAAWMVEQLFGMEKTAHGVNTCQLTWILKPAAFHCGSELARDEVSTFNIHGD
ncbi:hypothetical protein D9M69_455330 [compost metagenome]